MRAGGYTSWAEAMQARPPAQDWESLLRPYAAVGAPTLPGGLAAFYAVLGDRSRALAELGDYIRKRDPILIYLKTDPVWDSLRSDPRFHGLERRNYAALLELLEITGFTEAVSLEAGVNGSQQAGKHAAGAHLDEPLNALARQIAD